MIEHPASIGGSAPAVGCVLPAAITAATAPRYVPGTHRPDRTGDIFGRLTITEMLPDNRVRVSCECGAQKDIATATIIRKSRPVRSCGCLQREMYLNGGGRMRHGYSRTAIYHRWAAMIQRCTNPRAVNWNDYGGRSITVCERWLVFDNFIADMGEPPDPRLTLDRIDNDQGYRPDNVRWATRTKQIANRRTSSKGAMIGLYNVETIH